MTHGIKYKIAVTNPLPCHISGKLENSMYCSICILSIWADRYHILEALYGEQTTFKNGFLLKRFTLK